MAYTIHSPNGNLYTTDTTSTKSILYITLKDASEKLKELPAGYFLKDTHTKKKVEPNVK